MEKKRTAKRGGERLRKGKRGKDFDRDRKEGEGLKAAVH